MAEVDTRGTLAHRVAAVPVKNTLLLHTKAQVRTLCATPVLVWNSDVNRTLSLLINFGKHDLHTTHSKGKEKEKTRTVGREIEVREGDRERPA